MFRVFFKNGGTFTEEQGTWDDSPRDEIFRMEIQLPDSEKVVSLNGDYDKYYFSNIGRTTILKSSNGGLSAGDMKTEIIGKRMAGIDTKRGIVFIITVWKNSHIETWVHPLVSWLAAEGIALQSIHSGVKDI